MFSVLGRPANGFAETRNLFETEFYKINELILAWLMLDYLNKERGAGG
jgi:hypothetical protein